MDRPVRSRKNRAAPRPRGFRFVLSLSFTAIAVMGMVFVGVAFYVPFYSSTMDTVSSAHRQVLEQINLNLEDTLASIRRVSDWVYFSDIKKSAPGESIARDMYTLYDVNRDRIVSISAFTDDGKVLASAPLSVKKPFVRPEEQEWFVSAPVDNFYISGPHVQNLFMDSDNKYNWVVSVSRRIEVVSNGFRENGVLLVDMNFSGIEETCRRAALGETGYVYIIDAGGDLIFHPKQQNIYAGQAAENNLAAASYAEGVTRRETFEGQDRLVTVKVVGYTGWKIVGVSYVSEVAPYTRVMLFVVFVLLFGIGFMLLINLLVSAYIATPINRLEKSVRDLSHGGADGSVAAAGPAEVRSLAAEIDNLLDQRRNLMNAVLKEQDLKRKSELNALQAQINPHFLYNALDSIAWVIQDGEIKSAIDLITALSRLFRISISKGRTIISVADELEHARNYLTIQSVRFKGRFGYTFSVTDEARACATIKLIVQPIVENCINHGMEFMDGDGMITVEADVDGDGLFIRVRDNGMGMPEETAQRLLSSPAPANPGTVAAGSGIGLYNVQERIRIYFGAEYGLSICSEPDEGTEVTIRLPARRYEPGAGD
ncbi:MAG: histidine kinase [Clostridiales bacterium]|nr:histidine kinase [Clostridiales bacterium]